MSFGEKMKHLRKEKAWSQEELAGKVSTDTRQISLYENNKVSPSADTIIRIARTFDVSIDYLLIESVSRRPLNEDYEGISEQFLKVSFLTDEEKQLSAQHKIKHRRRYKKN